MKNVLLRSARRLAIWRNVPVQIADRREERRHPSAEAIHPPPQILTGRLVAPDEVGHVIEENWIRIVEGVAADDIRVFETRDAARGWLST